MKILYGVQATGNGHISRARAMAEALAAQGVEVDYLLSGRPREQLFDMQPFGDFQTRRGVTFVVENGRVNLWKTLVKIKYRQLFRDILELDLSGYDLVISDYEPITARAARRGGVPVLGISHQAAFLHDIPKANFSRAHYWVMNNLAPADINIGMHWHHFGAPIVPPIAPVHRLPVEIDRDLTLVYLPFENLYEVCRLLSRFARHRFVIYHPGVDPAHYKNVSIKPPSRDGFQEDLQRSARVLCNAGFELSSEVLQLGKRLLLKPVDGQMEQLSNVVALEKLELGWSMRKLDAAIIGDWLRLPPTSPVVYPDVAGALARWIATGMHSTPAQLATSLWAQTYFPPEQQIAKDYRDDALDGKSILPGHQTRIAQSLPQHLVI